MPVLDSGARGSTTTFVQRGIGDVLLAWENEAFLALKEFGADKFEIVVPVDQHPGRAAGGAWSTRSSTSTGRAAWPRPTSKYPLHADAGQEIAAKHFYRPASAAVAAKYASSSRSSSCSPSTTSSAAGQKAQETHFADGGVFDQIYQPEQLSRWPAVTRPTQAMTMPRSQLAACCPGFGLTLGFTLRLPGLIVLIPLGALFLKTRDARLGRRSGRAVSDPRVLAAYSSASAPRWPRRWSTPSSGCSWPGCWCATGFPGKRLVDALVDLPFALPTAVAGIALTALYAPTAGSARYSSRWASRSPSRRSASSWR